MELVIVKFTTFITLKGFDGCIKLGMKKLVEVFKLFKCFRFEFEGKNPYVVSNVIDDNEVIFETSFT